MTRDEYEWLISVLADSQAYGDARSSTRIRELIEDVLHEASYEMNLLGQTPKLDRSRAG